MHAMQLGSPARLDTLCRTQLDDPGPPGPGQLRVRVHASSINFHDYSVVKGHLPAAPGRILLSDCGGTVEAVGEGVHDFQPGDAVVSCFFPDWQDGPPRHADFASTPGDGIDGFACEVVVRPAQAFTHAPAGWTHAEAATLTTAGLTAWRALVVDGGLKAGDTVLVLGSGGVAVYALQLARLMGARVIATSSSDAKLQRLAALGADGLINYRTTPDWGQRVRQLTGGQGVDHVVETGGAGTLPQSIEACRIGGHIAMIGVLTGREGPIPTGLLMARQQRLQGLIVGSRRQQQDLVRALNGNPLRPVLDRTFAFDQLAEALQYEKSGAHLGKISLSGWS